MCAHICGHKAYICSHTMLFYALKIVIKWAFGASKYYKLLICGHDIVYCVHNWAICGEK